MAKGEPGSWEAAEDDVLNRALAATPSQRLEWLEEAVRFAWRFGALPRKGEEAGDQRQE